MTGAKADVADYQTLVGSDNTQAEAAEQIADLIEDGLLGTVDSPHGDGELGQEDDEARRAGYQGIEERKNLDDLADELRQKGDMDEGAILDLVASMKSGVESDTAGEDPEGEDPEGEDEDHEDETPEQEAERLADEKAKEDAPDRDDPEIDYYDADDLAAQLGDKSKIRVKVDGQYMDVEPSELMAGYSRTASWTRKSQALAEERKAFVEEAQRIQTAGQEAQNQLGFAAQVMQKLGAGPEVLAAMSGMYEHAAKQNEALQAHQRAIRMADAHASLIQRIPSWNDPEVMAADKRDMMNVARDLGASEGDLDQIDDPRTVELLWRAAQYEKMKGARQEVRRKIKRTPVLKPGQVSRRPAAAKGKAKRISERKTRLRQSGSTKDAAALIYDTVLGDE